MKKEQQQIERLVPDEAVSSRADELTDKAWNHSMLIYALGGDAIIIEDAIMVQGDNPLLLEENKELLRDWVELVTEPIRAQLRKSPNHILSWGKAMQDELRVSPCPWCLGPLNRTKLGLVCHACDWTYGRRP